MICKILKQECKYDSYSDICNNICTQITDQEIKEQLNRVDHI